MLTGRAASAALGDREGVHCPERKKMDISNSDICTYARSCIISFCLYERLIKRNHNAKVVMIRQ